MSAAGTGALPRAIALALATAWAPGAWAQATTAVELDAVEVVGARRALSSFPGAVTVVDGPTLREGQRRASLAEPLARVPGVLALERHNLAQDLQVQSRGFGARSTFGIRGLQLVVDGIPATAIDGQGQAANFPLDALDRIEVLRGPLALQYGNAAGGAILGYTDLDAAAPRARWQAWAGSEASARVAVRTDGATGDDAWRWRLHGSHLRTRGARPHAAAERFQAGAVARWRPRSDMQLRLVADVLAQPWTDDPLGLTRAQWEADPQGTDPAALRFDSRKRIDNRQAGARWEWDYAPGRQAWIGMHGIARDVVQFLSITPIAQRAPTSAGGVVDLGRRSTGWSAGHRRAWAGGALAFGLDGGGLDEQRRGHENFVAGPSGERVGVRGRLRRDEDNDIRSLEAWVAGDWRPAEGWSVLAAARRSRLEFASRDRFIAPGNGDDSGGRRFGETAWSVGAARAFAGGELFASAGSGFETPTMTELAYRADGASGFNRTLQPARFHAAELGARWRGDAREWTLAAYRIDGRDEIVPAASEGGRTAYANAARTRREGLEASLGGDLGDRWSWWLAANWIDARFERGFNAGRRIPGIPSAHGFAELAWRDPASGLAVALEAQLRGEVPVDDANSDAAPGHARFALALRWRSPERPGWHGFVRVDNLFDGDHVGSVIVNDRNGRHFEPAPPRGFTLGLGWTGG